MRLFERITENIKYNELASSYADSVLIDYKSLKVKTNKLIEIMATLSQTRRKNQAHERQEITESLFRILKMTEGNYNNYLYELNDLFLVLKNNNDKRLSRKTKHKVYFAINSRIELRKEFETIYRRFKSLAKGFDDIPMKAILSQMRESFDFNGKTLNENFEYIPEGLFSRYYDSTTGKIRYLMQVQDIYYVK